MKTERERWFYLAVCIVINACIGFCYSWSVFQGPLQELFNWELSTVSLTFTIILSISAFGQILAGKALDHFSPRQIIFLGGLLLSLGVTGLGFIRSIAWLYSSAAMFGFGMALIYPCTVTNTVKYFPDRRGMTTGLLAAGMASGTVVWAPLASNLIERFNVLAAFRIFGMIFIILVCGLSLFIKTAPDDYSPLKWAQSQKSKRSRDALDTEKTWRYMFKDFLFYAIAIAFIVSITAGMMVMSHASPILQNSIGFTSGKAAFFVGILAMCNTLGRAAWGIISDRIGRNLVFSILFAYLFAAGLLLWKSSSAAIFVAAFLSVGCCYGGFMGLMGAMTADAFGAKNMGINFSFMFMTVGIASIIGPIAAAGVRAYIGSYVPAFGIVAVLAGCGFLLTFVMHKVWKIRKQQ